MTSVQGSGGVKAKGLIVSSRITIGGVLLAGSVLASSNSLRAETNNDRAVAQQLLPQNSFHSLSHWRRLYGDQLSFEVTRNGKPAGSYQVNFSGNDNNWKVESRMALDFKAFLFFPYRFRYLGIEQWQGHQLTRFTSRIDRNGELSETFLTRSQDANGLPFWRGGLRQSPKGKPARESVKPLTNGSHNLALSNHYNHSIIQQNQLFNSLSGALNQIQLKKEDLERVSDGREEVLATRYRYTGDLKDTWVWYAHDRRWLRMRFIADDGSSIQLNCQRCYPD
ncbi:DUF6134 family protein [Oceanospirillum linum]|uniref:Uncharacterized protein n=1 Tax=Oceanospirillum linum TaxID=966 RepID=A0A1T1HBK0_OCELI|nr:DUF6134 family protein [Oceanospirillum linum]OOV87219.1 hypothetical protein BTA35_0209520 [Oceanospirillum linum]SEF78165.1 hypothetical protein SAMN04489856_102303 [Oleiphilus messinensis]SMP17992.1 hypothetical protein SAMN06264348_103301 [Oceanospirillum linum]